MECWACAKLGLPFPQFLVSVCDVLTDVLTGVDSVRFGGVCLRVGMRCGALFVVFGGRCE
jgi:hypothetical protein